MTLKHQLEHEAGHLASMTVGCGVVVDDGDVVGALEKTAEVVLVNGHLVIDRCQTVGLAYGVRYERGVVDTTGHVALVAGEQQHVVEVEVTRFKYTHELDALSRFAVKRYRCGLHDLGNEAL